MINTFDDIRETVLHLPKGDQMRLLSLVALEVADAHPGVETSSPVSVAARPASYAPASPSGCSKPCAAMAGPMRNYSPTTRHSPPRTSPMPGTTNGTRGTVMTS